jgi:hypothetical protein
MISPSAATEKVQCGLPIVVLSFYEKIRGLAADFRIIQSTQEKNDEPGFSRFVVLDRGAKGDLSSG